MAENEPTNDYFRDIKVQEGCTLRRKTLFEYVTKDDTYNIELFEHQDGTFYAIGVPQDNSRLVVYGTNYVDSAEFAMQILLHKIERENINIRGRNNQDAPAADNDDTTQQNDAQDSRTEGTEER